MLTEKQLREHYVSYSDLAKIQADLDEQKRQNLVLTERLNSMEKLYHEQLDTIP